MPATWFTADHHFGHTKIIDACERPFTDAADMNHGLVERWNEVVSYDDTVYVLGDFAMGPRSENLPIAGKLNGYKILVPGNHDMCWPGLIDPTKDLVRQAIRFNKQVLAYLEAGFDEIWCRPLDEPNSINLPGSGTKVELCHFPYAGSNPAETRYADQMPPDRGSWLVHGHNHNSHQSRWNDTPRGGQRNGRMINAGVDVWGWYPVHADTIDDLIAKAAR